MDGAEAVRQWRRDTLLEELEEDLLTIKYFIQNTDDIPTLRALRVVLNIVDSWYRNVRQE